MYSLYSNVSAPFPYRKYGGPVTNNQTEIEAAIVAMNTLKDEGNPRNVLCTHLLSIINEYIFVYNQSGYSNVALLTDSKLVVKTMKKSIFYWLKNGWITTSGHEVINKEEFRNLLRASEGLTIKWVSLIDSLNRKRDFLQFICIPRFT